MVVEVRRDALAQAQVEVHKQVVQSEGPREAVVVRIVGLREAVVVRSEAHEEQVQVASSAGVHWV